MDNLNDRYMDTPDGEQAAGRSVGRPQPRRSTLRVLAWSSLLSLGLGCSGGSGDTDSESGASATTTTTETATATETAATTTTASGSESASESGSGTFEETESGTPETTSTSTTGVPDPFCGDGNVDDGEECDDGNAEDGDACLSTCVAASCGDGVVGPGEECDDGNADNTDTCLDSCAAASCGDGFVGPGEACDDGNQEDADDCTNACALASCGDGAVQGEEECDDGNDDNADACLGTCLSASCGDSILYEGVEECDDGNADNSDECTELCAAPSCSDGIISGAESDVDCGGDTCDKCGLDQACGADSDCLQGSCIADKCTIVATCDEILALDPNAVSGTYTIDPDGEGGGEAFPVSCDMDTDGGGWTLVFHVFDLGGSPAGLKENDFIGLYDHNRFTDESWSYDAINKMISDGVGEGMVTLVDQGALDVDLFTDRWDDVRMSCALGNKVEAPTNYAQVNGYATANDSFKLHGATANGSSYMVDAGLQSVDQGTIWHDNEVNSSNSGHYLCDYTNAGSSGAQFGFCYTDHLNNPNNLDYGDSIVSIAFGTSYGADGWSVGFTAECGDMGTTAQQNAGTYSIWIR